MTTKANKSSHVFLKIKKNYKVILLVILCFVIPEISLGKYFFYGASYEACFTPGENCAQKVITEIDQAKKQILVQAYVFTDISIARALVGAKKRGVDVKIILDKSQAKGKYTLINFFKNNKINPSIDYLPSIAHNKIIIIDEDTVITGSYNYTKGAAKRNAENLLIIKDTGLAQDYIQNWYKRERAVVR